MTNLIVKVFVYDCSPVLFQQLKAITECFVLHLPLSFPYTVSSLLLQLEAELVQKEQRLLKIDFLSENISDLMDRIRAVVENSKQDVLLFAQRVRRALQALLASLYKTESGQEVIHLQITKVAGNVERQIISQSSEITDMNSNSNTDKPKLLGECPLF